MTDPTSPRPAIAKAGSQGAQRRVDALREAGADRTRRAEKAAESGLRKLLKDGGQISFKAVARASGVSTKFLHTHRDLSVRIKTLRAQQRGHQEAQHQAVVSGEPAVIAALRRQLRDQHERHEADVRALRARLKEQERQIAALYGRLATET